MLRPFIVAFQSLPKVAVAPIIVLWLGFGLASKVAIVALLTFFPVLITGLAGFQAVEAERIELLRSLSASRWNIFTKVKFWTALPSSLPAWKWPQHSPWSAPSSGNSSVRSRALAC